MLQLPVLLEKRSDRTQIDRQTDILKIQTRDRQTDSSGKGYSKRGPRRDRSEHMRVPQTDAWGLCLHMRVLQTDAWGLCLRSIELDLPRIGVLIFRGRFRFSVEPIFHASVFRASGEAQ